MFTSFEGQYRQRPEQSLRGASKTEYKNDLLRRTQAERFNRETERLQNSSSVKIQSCFRSYICRKYQMMKWRAEYDEIMKTGSTEKNISLLTIYICRFFRESQDGERLVKICQRYIQLYNGGHLQFRNNREIKINTLGLSSLSANKKKVHMNCGEDPRSSRPSLYQLTRLLVLCLRYLQVISNTHQLIAAPLRMLEIFTDPKTLKNISQSLSSDVSCDVFHFIVCRGYFSCMPKLLNDKVPSDIEVSPVAPTPLASSLLELIRRPLMHVTASQSKMLCHCILRHFSSSFLCPAHSNQVSRFVLQALSQREYRFPFTDWIESLLELLDTSLYHKTYQHQCVYTFTADQFFSPWLLYSLLALGAKNLGDMPHYNFNHYLRVIQNLLHHLPPSPSNVDEEDDDNSNSLMDDSHMREEFMMSLENVRVECLQYLESQSFVSRVLLHSKTDKSVELTTTLSTICFVLLTSQKLPVHKFRLLFNLAFSPHFLQALWFQCSVAQVTHKTGGSSNLLSLLSSALVVSSSNLSVIIPLLTVFSALFLHYLLTLDDQDFYNHSLMPFSIRQLVEMTRILRDVSLGVVDLAHPDLKRNLPVEEFSSQQCLFSLGDIETPKWAHIFKTVTSLLSHLYNRDVRLSFCPPGHWLSPNITIQYERPSQMYRGQNATFVRHRYGPGNLRSTIRTADEEEGPPLSNKEIRRLILLTELPFVVSFLERVRVLQKLILDDKEQSQSGAEFGTFSGPIIWDQFLGQKVLKAKIALISRLQQSYYKPNLKYKMRVQLVNAVGLDEAGVDGGGVFREFLNELLKTGFDPNRGFFQYTADHQLYPNPQAELINPDYLRHYYFLGRMLGKALYENMLVELPFASFFLSKILSRYGSNLDFQHLSSLDPEMYKHLLSLKTYEGDISDLSLDFTVVTDALGQSRITELKPGGSVIPVTNDNCIEYVHLMADYFLNKQIRQHSLAMRQGISDVIDLNWLCMFDHNELQVLISGAHVPVDLADLRRYTNYSGGYTDDHPVISLFWKVVASFTDHQCRKLLRFVTSCSRPPLLGFKDLWPAFCIHNAGNEPERLPTSSTCMNLLKLPEFGDQEAMRKKLLYAIESSAGFELS